MMMTKKRYDKGDKVKVIDAQTMGSGGHYENGDVFEVDWVDEYEDGDVIHTTTPATDDREHGIQLYSEEVVPYEEEDLDVATELAKGLLQAIEDKQEEEVLMADHVAIGTEPPAYDMPSELEKESRGLGEFDGRSLVEPMPVSRALETMQRVLLKARKERADKAVAELKETEEKLALFADKVKVGELSRQLGVSSEEIEAVSGGFTSDVITSPSHYANSAIEPIEYMADKLPAFDDGFTAFCAGNVLKYVSRAPHKHATPIEDLKKARQYLDFAIEHEEKKRK